MENFNLYQLEKNSLLDNSLIQGDEHLFDKLKNAPHNLMNRYSINNAIIGGNAHIILYLLNRYIYDKIEMINMSYQAFKDNKIQVGIIIVNFFIKKYGMFVDRTNTQKRLNIPTPNIYEQLLSIASSKGDLDTFKLIFSLFDIYINDIIQAIYFAIGNNKLNILKYIFDELDKYQTSHNYRKEYLEDAISYAKKYAGNDIVSYLLSLSKN